jgi:hypothetical protein
MKRQRKYKSVASKSIHADKRRAKRRVAHEADRKLARKLYHIAEQINQGHFAGVKNSPLLACNLHRVRRYLNRGINPELLDVLSFAGGEAQ